MICGVRRYYDLNDDLKPEEMDECITDATKYCIRYWSDHLLSDGERDKHLSRIVPSFTHFLTDQQLFWFEALALMRELELAASALENVKEWLTLVCTQHCCYPPTRRY